MHVEGNHDRRPAGLSLAGTALIAALSTVFLMLGTFIPVNTIFFTALAAYFIGYSVYKYGLKYGGLQWVACVLLDALLNPDKLNWILYLCFGGYIFFSECIFYIRNRKRNLGGRPDSGSEGGSVDPVRKQLRLQLVLNWGLFNLIYIPVLVFFRGLLFDGEFAVGTLMGGIPGILLLWALGQVGWIIYDKAYRAFFRTIRERKL